MEIFPNPRILKIDLKILWKGEHSVFKSMGLFLDDDICLGALCSFDLQLNVLPPLKLILVLCLLLVQSQSSGIG